MRVGFFAFFLLLASFGSASAQTVADPPSLPPASALGEGWILVADVPPGDLDASFRGGAFGVYAGPNGSRAVLAIYAVADGMTAVRDSWELANSVFDSYRSEMDYGFDSGRESDLEDAAQPAGCADTRRTYGADQYGFGEFPVGLTLCAADPDLIVLAYTSGQVLSATGVNASDAVVEVVLASDSSATPTAATPTAS